MHSLRAWANLGQVKPTVTIALVDVFCSYNCLKAITHSVLSFCRVHKSQLHLAKCLKKYFQVNKTNLKKLLYKKKIFISIFFYKYIFNNLYKLLFRIVIKIYKVKWDEIQLGNNGLVNKPGCRPHHHGISSYLKSSKMASKCIFNGRNMTL